jgi:hypothetical protein
MQVPIQIIDSTFATPPAACTSAQSSPDTTPADAGFNGILGVGLFNQDCGSACATNATNGQYFSCSGASCSQTTTNIQVQNPVSALPGDNNGVILQLPAVASGGAPSVSGTLTLGIGTQANNTPGGVTAFAASTDGEITTVFSASSGSAITSFIDSGSSALFFPAISQTPDCNSAAGGAHGSNYSGFFCPTAATALSATNFASGSSSSGAVSFTLGNAFDDLSGGNSVFSDIGAAVTGSSDYFDWGLPFFFGKNVYVEIEATSSPLGPGPLWAY